MKSFLVIKFDLQTWHDGIFGKDFRDALTETLKDDPEYLGWSIEECEGVDCVYDETNKKWRWKEGSLEKFVDMIYKALMGDHEIDVLDITDPTKVVHLPREWEE